MEGQSLTLFSSLVGLLFLGIVASLPTSPETELTQHGYNQLPVRPEVQALIDSGIIPQHEDMFIPTVDLIKKRGYPAEAHTVTTEDGYILELHRIPYSPKLNNSNATRVPVLLMHGLISSSADWILGETDKFYGYILADAGYDVWIGNFRGNTYCKKHVNLSTSDKEFWDFSYHEHGVYDLPAKIDYIIKETGFNKIFYIGYSMGTQSFYIAMSSKPEYNDKIIAAFHLAPIAYLSNMKSPLRYTTPFLGVSEWVLSNLGVHEFSPSNFFISTILGKWLCDGVAPTTAVCSNVLFLIAGYNSKQFNATLFPIIVGHTPAGTSVKNMLHFGQGIKSGEFLQYDYGTSENKQRYGQSTPPAYELEKVTAPVVLIYSGNDWLSAEADVNKLTARLPNVGAKLKVSDPYFNHLDYVYAIEAYKLVYLKTTKLMTAF